MPEPTVAGNRNRFRIPSLRLRIVVLFLVAALLLLGGFATSTFVHVRGRMQKSFDAALLAHAQSIAGFTQIDERRGLDVELTDDTAATFARRHHPEMYLVLDSAGVPLRSRHATSKAPAWVAPQTQPSYRDFLRGRERYRGILLPARVTDDEEDEGAPPQQVTVFYASSRRYLDHDLEDVFRNMAVTASVVFLLSIGAAWSVARRGLLPLEDLAHQTTNITAVTLDRRLPVGELPVELRSFSLAFNELLSRLELAFERERRFSADAAHELRTPVASLKSGIQAALLSPPNVEEDRAALRELLMDVQRLEELCESLLFVTGSPEFTASQQGAALITSEELRREIERMVESFAGRAAECGATLRLDLSGYPVPTTTLQGEITATRRILANLIGNSLRHGGPGVEVTVEAVSAPKTGAGPAPSCESVRICVRDTGPGISEAFRPRLFDRFARGDDSRTRNTGGAGLGLAISRSLAEQYGGTLRHESPAGGRGALFTWELRGRG